MFGGIPFSAFGMGGMGGGMPGMGGMHEEREVYLISCARRHLCARVL